MYCPVQGTRERDLSLSVVPCVLLGKECAAVQYTRSGPKPGSDVAVVGVSGQRTACPCDSERKLSKVKTMAFGHGKPRGNILMDCHSPRYFERGICDPGCFDRLHYGQKKLVSSKTSGQVSEKRVRLVLENHTAVPMDSDVEREMHDIIRGAGKSSSWNYVLGFSHVIEEVNGGIRL